MARNIYRRKEETTPGPRRTRILITGIVMAVAFILVLFRSWDLQVRKHSEWISQWKQHETKITLKTPRGAIYDREGRVLAYSAQAPSVYAIPSVVADPKTLGRELSEILDVSEKRLVRKLSKKSSFAWVKRQVSPAQAEAVKALGKRWAESHPKKISPLGLRREYRRYYPHRSLAGALLGFTGIDGDGLEGLEREYDRYLRGRDYVVDGLKDAVGRKAMENGSLPADKLSGYALDLTIDARIQEITERHLTAQIEATDARGGVAIVMDPRTGDILSLAQTPSFDPNTFRQASPRDWRLRAITDVLEPGSTIKPFLVSAAFDQKKVRPNAIWNGYKGRMKVGRKWVEDVHPEERLTTLEILQKSSNVGAVQVAQKLGKELWYRYMRAYGLGETTDLGLRGERKGSVRPPEVLGQIHLATYSYGYGFDATPIQMVRAMGAIANGGELMRPRLVRSIRSRDGKAIEEFPPRSIRRVIGDSAAKDVTRGLIMVTEEGGTARRARVRGHLVAGKTGTSRKLVGGAYNRSKVRTTFLGFVPANNPRLVAYILVDEPKNKYRYGGVVAAPIFSQIATEALPYLGVEATEAVSEVVEPLALDDDVVAEFVNRQARPWWLEDSVIAGSKAHRVVPDLNGMPLAMVVQRIGDLGLKVRVEGSGLVVSQEPRPGALVAPDTTVALELRRPGQRSIAGAQ